MTEAELRIYAAAKNRDLPFGWEDVIRELASELLQLRSEIEALKARIAELTPTKCEARVGFDQLTYQGVPVELRGGLSMKNMGIKE